MKQKSDSSQPVTKGFLRSELKTALDSLREEIDQKAQDYHDEVLTKLDGVMGELKTIREETSIGAHQVLELKEPVDGHEKRIIRLEELQPAA